MAEVVVAGLRIAYAEAGHGPALAWPIPGAGHLANVEAPEVFDDHVRAFLVSARG